MNHLAFNRTRISATLLDHSFAFATGHGLFSADRVDDGTLLLLDHLPPKAPESVLDMGCGYGALGLPVAAAFPGARMVLVDRDLLAVEYARFNAVEHTLDNVTAHGSLGYRDVQGQRFDWVLCNVPARIGPRAVAYLMGGGARCLAPGGELRVVVIRDLGPVVERMASERHWPVRKAADGARHVVYCMDALETGEDEHEALYLRDTVTVEAEGVRLSLDRPHDLSEEHSHRTEGLPLLMDCLPRKPTGRVVCHRCGYGAASVVLAQRGAQVVVADRDLLALVYTRRNAQRLGVRVEERAVPWLSAAFTGETGRVEWLVGEVNTTAGEDVARAEMAEAHLHARQMLWLCLGKWARSLLKSTSKPIPGMPTVLATRGAYCVMRQSGVSGR